MGWMTPVYFDLKTHMSKKAFIYALRSLRHKGGKSRSPGAALLFIWDHIFTVSSGSRLLQGVPQILFILNECKSNDDVSRVAINLKWLVFCLLSLEWKMLDRRSLNYCIVLYCPLPFQSAYFWLTFVNSAGDSCIYPVRYTNQASYCYR